MQVPLSPHGEELLRSALALQPDQSPTQIVEQALADRLQRKLPPAKNLSPDELEAALDRMAQFSDKIPLLPDEAFSRESLYQDHD
jgi:hypothetical protein